MLHLLKRAVSLVPLRGQIALRRTWSTWALRLGRFTKSDEPEYARLSEWVSVGDCVLDVGANVGHYTAALSRLVGPTGSVFAFEPMAEAFHLLAYNARLFPFPNVTLLNVAASDKVGLVSLETPSLKAGQFDFYYSKLTDSPTGRRVFCLPIDALSIPGRVRFVKIDVEGHEFGVVRGMEKLLREHKPVLVVEGGEPEMRDFINALGYTVRRFPGSPNMTFFPEK